MDNTLNWTQPIYFFEWVTVDSVFQFSSTTDVRIIVPVDNACKSPDITVVADSSEVDVMFQSKYIARASMQNWSHNICKYERFCGCCCSNVHIEVENITLYIEYCLMTITSYRLNLRKREKHSLVCNYIPLGRHVYNQYFTAIASIWPGYHNGEGYMENERTEQQCITIGNGITLRSEPKPL